MPKELTAGLATAPRTTRLLYRSVALSTYKTGSQILISSRLPTRMLLGLRSTKVSMPLIQPFLLKLYQQSKLLRQPIPLQPTSSLATLSVVPSPPSQE